ncbi:MAG: transglycosylase SLT domain-containing protein [Desulfarculales bacterium]|jgi:soluble lytic murein transglycosylase-like protein|nr:transglycosylase SLT domain-containing protein [Desulfarculales bacterium]
MQYKRIFITFAMLLLLIQFAGIGNAAEIPKAAEQYRATVIRTARAVWGMDAPVAVFAAQIHTESRWNAQAKSRAGAQGLAQFMPQTARWLPSVAPETGKPMPYNPGWAIRALITYDLYLWRQVGPDGGATAFERMAFTLSAYNGGLGWVRRDRNLAVEKGLDGLLWFGSVETVNAGRSIANWKENCAYPRLILRERQYLYKDAGWGPDLPEETE